MNDDLISTAFESTDFEVGSDDKSVAGAVAVASDIDDDDDGDSDDVLRFGITFDVNTAGFDELLNSDCLLVNLERDFEKMLEMLAFSFQTTGFIVVHVEFWKKQVFTLNWMRYRYFMLSVDSHREDYLNESYVIRDKRLLYSVQ